MGRNKQRDGNKVTARKAKDEAGQVSTRISNPQRIEKRRKELVEAATGLFGTMGYHETSIRDIALKMECSVGLLYNYLETKEDALLLVIEKVLNDYIEQIPPAIAEETEPFRQLLAALRAYCRVVDANPIGVTLAYRETATLGAPRRKIIQDLELKTNALIETCVEKCIAAGLIENTNTRLAVYPFVMAAHGWALKRWAFLPKITSEEYFNDIIFNTLKVLVTPKGAQELHKESRKGARV